MRRRMLGLAFVVVLLATVALSVLTYRQAFEPATFVLLRADRAGLALRAGADVKLRGVIVGEVRAVTADGSGATLRLALDPAATRAIPGNVAARLLPKTLFGEKYVDLVPPAGPPAAPIRAGDVIDQDRSATAVELGRVLDGVLPLLQAIRPDRLAVALGALAYALAGRGERLGADLVSLETLLAQLNREMPTIAEDVRRLAEVADVYQGVADDLLAILRNATVTATTLVDQRAQLAGFLADTTDFADAARTFLDKYDDRLIRLGQVSRPVLELLASYAPEYPCLFRGLLALQPRAVEVFAAGRMHITLEITKDNGKYVAGRDDPIYGAHNGPDCHGLPDPAVPAPEARLDDGYRGGSGTAAMGLAGTAQEAAVIKPLVAAATGTPADQVPDIAVLLWGPLLRGALVSAV